MDAQEFGLYLRDLRKEKKLTLKQLADESHVSQSYITNVENNKRGIPSPEILKKLADPLGVSHNELMFNAGHITMDDVNKDFGDVAFLNGHLNGIENIKTNLMNNGDIKNWFKHEVSAIMSQEGFADIEPKEFMIQAEDLVDLMFEKRKAGESIDELYLEHSAMLRALNRIMRLASRPIPPLLVELEKEGLDSGRVVPVNIGQLMYGVDTQDEIEEIKKLSDNQKKAIKLYAHNRMLIEELLRIRPAGMEGFWEGNKEAFDNRELTIELLDELIKTRPDESVIELINYLFDWSKEYIILERNGEDTYAYTKSEWNELTNYLKRSALTYDGLPLKPEDRQRILEMLKLMFPDRQ